MVHEEPRDDLPHRLVRAHKERPHELLPEHLHGEGHALLVDVAAAQLELIIVLLDRETIRIVAGARARSRASHLARLSLHLMANARSSSCKPGR